MSTLYLTLVGLGLRIAVTLIVIINTLLMARALGPAGFGEYFIFYRLVSVLAAFADFGLPQSANAFYGRFQTWRASIHRVVIGLVPVLWLAVTFVGGLTLWFGKEILLPHMMPLLAVMAFAILPLSVYANLWNSMMIGAGFIWRVNLIQLLMCSFSLLLTVVVVVIFRGGLLGAALSYSMVMLSQFTLMFLIAHRVRGDKDSDGPPPDLWRQMLHFGLRGYPGSISSFLWTRLPVFILNASYGPVVVGFFSVGQQVVEKMLLPAQAVRDVVYQKMSVLPGPSASAAMNRYIRLTLWSMVVIVGLGSVGIPLLMRSLLGRQYDAVIPITLILLGGALFGAVSLLLDTFFVNQLHRPGLVSILAWLKFFVGLALATLLILTHSAKGAAVAIVLTQILGTVIHLFLYVRRTGTRLKELILLDSDDLRLVRDQLLSLMKRKRESSNILPAK